MLSFWDGVNDTRSPLLRNERVGETKAVEKRKSVTNKRGDLFKKPGGKAIRSCARWAGFCEDMMNIEWREMAMGAMHGG